MWDPFLEEFDSLEDLDNELSDMTMIDVNKKTLTIVDGLTFVSVFCFVENGTYKMSSALLCA